MNMNNLDLQG